MRPGKPGPTSSRTDVVVLFVVNVSVVCICTHNTKLMWSKDVFLWFVKLMKKLYTVCRLGIGKNRPSSHVI